MAPGSTTTTSTRWCPTPEQLMILEEMYRGGVRTPNATQIQHITAHLSLYGKIEGKNVFYWFQNHKARDRQKLRRRLAKHLLFTQPQQQHSHHLLCYPQFSHQLIQPNPHDYHHQPHQFFNPVYPTNTCLSPPGFHPASSHDYYSSSPCFMPPQGDVTCEQAMGYALKLETNPEMIKDEAPTARAYNDDWVVISSSLNSRPVKTLELFPVTSSSECNLREESPPVDF